MNTASGQNVDILSRKGRRIAFVEATTDLDQKRAARFSLRRPRVLQQLRCLAHLSRGEIIKHDDIRTSIDGGIRFLDVAALDFDFHGEASCGARRGDGRGDGLGYCRGRDGGRRLAFIVAGPDMVVLEHGHGAEVVAMRVRAADKNAILLHEPEARGVFAGSGDDSLPAMGAEDLDEGRCP